ncbi:MAG: peptidylprolyl isomerase [Gemmatimonadetes bacterium]|nr:peptidylprolyl isomerase [Gemmatimonadota bacterium]MDA1102419.1 peptidylprolyl isomerase [Gemmatimonadota bacterium]
MTNRPARPCLLGLFVLLLTAVSSCAPEGGSAARGDDAFLRLLAAEEARPTGGPELTVLIEGTAAEQDFLRQVAVRGLGRLENPELLGDITPLLSDSSATVRQFAANAVAQAVHTSEGDVALESLLNRLALEDDPAVRGVIGHAAGRLALTARNRQRVEETLIGLSGSAERPAPAETLTGVMLGFEALVRRGGSEGIGPQAAERLEALMSHGVSGTPSVDNARIRSLAVSTLGQARRMSQPLVERAFDDPSADVRATAARHLDAVPTSQRSEIIRRALEDGSAQIAIEAIRHTARLPRDTTYCEYLLAAAAPTVLGAVRVVAIDALAQPCPAPAQQRASLREAAMSLDASATSEWQPSAHALVSLAQLSRDDSAPLLSSFVSHANPFVRAYGARAARLLGDRGTLRELVDDPVANVKTAAIEGVFALEDHSADPLLIAQLAHDDPQLLMTAARLLEGTTDRASAATAAMTAFERISLAGRETWRDSRRALLTRLAEVGDAMLTERLIPFLSDYDPMVAADVAGILGTWNGQSYAATPTPRARAALPTSADLRSMDEASVVLHMQGGPTVEISLLPYAAPTNTYRFVRLVRAGYFDGLTFHRWAPNFVLQGGSPSAHEYQGDGPFTRDEVGLDLQWRGTVGISTRGHDTGDGQIYINLIDNVRLNHGYTVIGTVVAGMDVVDSSLEGAVIERAEFRPAR